MLWRCGNILYVSIFLSCFFYVVVGRTFRRQDLPTNEGNDIESNDAYLNGQDPIEHDLVDRNYDAGGEKNCWVTLDAVNHFNTMDNIEGKYEEARKDYQKQVDEKKFDAEMLKAMLENRAVAKRALFKVNGNSSAVPAGINLGGNCVMKTKDSLLFFHRLKLRNDTHFRVVFVKSDLYKMVVRAHISLNDLHLVGDYQRVQTDLDPSNLFYRPTLGTLEILLRGAEYTMEGRYILRGDKLMVEHIISTIILNGALLSYVNDEGKPTRTTPIEISDFLDTLRSDLNDWLKDYFNDYLIYLPQAADSKVQVYDKVKTLALNDYVDSTIRELKERQRKLRLFHIKLPRFNIYTINGIAIRLNEGYVTGLDSMHRRSVVTSVEDKGQRTVNAIVGFSNLKSIYKYEVVTSPSAPRLAGSFILSANDLTAHLSVTLLKDPATADLKLDLLKQLKPEFLTIEGPANMALANYRTIVERQLVALMTNTLHFTVLKLRSLVKCDPTSELEALPTADEQQKGGDPDDLPTTSVPDELSPPSTPYASTTPSGGPTEPESEEPGVTDQQHSAEPAETDQPQSTEPPVENEDHTQPGEPGMETTDIDHITETGVITAGPEDYVLNKESSIELEVTDKSGKRKTIHVIHKDSYLISGVKNQGPSENQPSGDLQPAQDSAETNQPDSPKVPSHPDTATTDPQPGAVAAADDYVLNKDSSIELMVPDKSGKEEKVHVKHKDNYVISRNVKNNQQAGENVSAPETIGLAPTEDTAANDLKPKKTVAAGAEDYVLNKDSSVELVVPDKRGKEEKVHVKHNDNYVISRNVNKNQQNEKNLPSSETSSVHDAESADETEEAYGPQTNNAENDPKPVKIVAAGAEDYVLNKDSSIELVVPDKRGKEKKVHVKHNDNYIINRSVNKNQQNEENLPASETSPVQDTEPADETEEANGPQTNNAENYPNPGKIVGAGAEDYVLNKDSSIELVVPDKRGKEEKVHVKHNDNYIINRNVNKNQQNEENLPSSETSSVHDAESADETEEAYGPQTNNAENYPNPGKIVGAGAEDYVLNKDSSIELVVPDKRGKEEKVHVKHNDNYIINRNVNKNQQNEENLPSSETSPVQDTEPADETEEVNGPQTNKSNNAANDPKPGKTVVAGAVDYVLNKDSSIELMVPDKSGKEDKVHVKHNDNYVIKRSVKDQPSENVNHQFPKQPVAEDTATDTQTDGIVDEEKHVVNKGLE